MLAMFSVLFNDVWCCLMMFNYIWWFLSVFLR